MSKQIKIIIFSIIYTLGIISFFYSHVLPLCFLMFGIIFYFYKKRNLFSINYFIGLLFIFSIAIINTFFHLNYSDDLTPYTDKDVQVEAQVLSIPSNSIENKTKFYAKIYKLQTENYDILTLNNAKSYVTITDKQEKINNIKIGDILRIKGKLKAPNHSENPSQFDYARYLQFKNTFSLLYSQKGNWEIISQADDFKINIIRKLNDTRNSILNIHKQNIKSPMIEVLGGIIFGDDAVNPDENTKDIFIKSGIIHILAASGMNVTLIFGIWFFFAKNLRFNYKFSILSGIFLIFIYTCTTGFGPPIIRAFLMLTLILTGKLIDKRTPTLSLLFIVGLLMLIYNPLLVFDIGFQLSFTATFSLIISSPLFVFKFKNKYINYALGACSVPLIAQIFIAPLQMYYFNTFSLYSIFANIAIIPVLSIVSFIGFLSSILALIPQIAQKICLIADYILNPLLVYIVKSAEFFASLPNSVIDMQKPALLQIILYFLFIISTVTILRLKILNKKYFIILSFIFITFLFTFIPKFNNNTETIIFSVGNADSILIKTPNKKYFLIDTGKMAYLTSSSQANYIILKYFKDNGIKNLDGLILTHFDSDHAGGCIDILENINVKKIYISNSDEDTKLSNKIKTYLNENNLSYIVVDKELSVFEEKDFVIKAIALSDKSVKSENDKSVVILLKNKKDKFLFMGDGSTLTYKFLPEEYKNSNFIKVGHHGAKNSLNNEMINNCDFFIISTGENIYNHPHPATIELLKNSNKKYLRTDDFNAIKIISANKKTEIKYYSPTLKRFKHYANVNKY